MDRYPLDRYPLDRYSLDRYSLDRYPLDRYSLDRYSLDVSTAGAAVLDALATADHLPVGHPHREAAQRKAARMVAASPQVLDDPRLAPVRGTLRRWARLVPHLLDDDTETRTAADGRAVVRAQMARLRAIDDDPHAALRAVDRALSGLDLADAGGRLMADRRAHGLAERRAPVTAAVLNTLTAHHVDDDRHRGITDWRSRMAIANGTDASALRRLQAAVAGATPLAAMWWATRSPLAGQAWSDRRAGPTVGPRTLAQHAEAAAAAIGASAPALAAHAHRQAGCLREGTTNQVVAEPDGRLTATVAHRPTPRGGLMVAHELGHAVHASSATARELPGALVGEAAACWASLVAGRAALAAAVAAGDPLDVAAAALALGDLLVEELFVSAAVSAFEDRWYRSIAAGDTVTPSVAAVWWATEQQAAYGGAVAVPAYARSGWARLPSLAAQPGHALAYSWATLLALAVEARHAGSGHDALVHAWAAGGVDADDFTRMLGFDGEEWVVVGLTALDRELRGLGRLLSQ